MDIRFEKPTQHDVAALVTELDEYQKALYPPQSNHLVDIDSLHRPNVLFAVAREAQGVAVGCGAIVLNGDFGEVKRFFVRPQCRGGGIAKGLMAFLEGEAVKRGYRLFMLETGIRQPEALSFYERCGYLRRGPFADYKEDPLSVFMYKRV